jgi:predicted HTH transcriptional regulator
MDKVELAGTGIRRMREAVAAAGLPPPKITQTTFFTIMFKRPLPEGVVAEDKKKPLGARVTDKVTERVTENQSRILQEMKKDKNVTSKRLSEIVGISERKIKENIKLLKNKGLVKRIGPDRGGYWEIWIAKKSSNGAK